MLALFAKWDEEDSCMTDAEVSDENRAWEEFKANINAERDSAGAGELSDGAYNSAVDTSPLSTGD